MLQKLEQIGVGFWTRPWFAILAGPFSRVHVGLTYTLIASAVTVWNHLFGRAE